MNQPKYIPKSHSVLNTTACTIPTIPPTPAPKTINEIQTDARDRFAGIIWIQKESSRPIEDYFVDYDNWEKYSENKSYSKRIYQAAYKGVMREYHNYLCILNGEEGDEYYVIAKRLRNELEALEPYCTCAKCISSFLNPMKYIWCDFCTKCIKAGPGFAKEEYIRKAKELKEVIEKQKPIPSKYGKYLQGYSHVKITELIVVGVIILISICLYIFSS